LGLFLSYERLDCRLQQRGTADCAQFGGGSNDVASWISQIVATVGYCNGMALPFNITIYMFMFKFSIPSNNLRSPLYILFGRISPRCREILPTLCLFQTSQYCLHIHLHTSLIIESIISSSPLPRNSRTRSFAYEQSVSTTPTKITANNYTSCLLPLHILQLIAQRTAESLLAAQSRHGPYEQSLNSAWWHGQWSSIPQRQRQRGSEP
jgi:hypothetical protein